jgi:hypothetical protein
MRRKDRKGPGMITVFSGGETWLTVREDLGRTALPACAHPGEHWQKKLAARRADKQMTGFTAGRLFEKLRDLRQPRFWVQRYI